MFSGINLNLTKVITYGVILVITIVIIYFVYKAIKKSGALAHQQDVGTDEVGDFISKETIEVLKALSENLHEDIHCFWCARDNSLYDDLGMLSTNELVATSNIYNKLYEKEDNETFYQALNNEYYSLDSFSTNGKVEVILQRLRAEGVS